MLYADRAPEGYRIADNRQQIDVDGLVFFPGTSQREAEWKRAVPGEGLIGASAHEFWPNVMAYAVPNK